MKIIRIIYTEGGKGIAKTLEEPAYGTPHHLKHTNKIVDYS